MKLYKASETAMLLGITTDTLDIWYRFKRQNPDNKYAKMLPEIKHKEGNQKQRFWTEDDIFRLIEYKNTIPQGRNGIMGSVTQKYVKKEDK